MHKLLFISAMFVIIVTSKQKAPGEIIPPLIDNSFTILTIGLPGETDYRAMNTVAEKYGVTVKHLGCTIPKEMWEQFHKHNDSVYGVLHKKFKVDWMAFRIEVSDMIAIQEKIMQVVKAEPYVNKLDTSLYKNDERLFFEIHITNYKSIFEVDAYSYRHNGNPPGKFIYYKMIVNIKNRAAMLI